MTLADLNSKVAMNLVKINYPSIFFCIGLGSANQCLCQALLFCFLSINHSSSEECFLKKKKHSVFVLPLLFCQSFSKQTLAKVWWIRFVKKCLLVLLSLWKSGHGLWKRPDNMNVSADLGHKTKKGNKRRKTSGQSCPCSSRKVQYHRSTLAVTHWMHVVRLKECYLITPSLVWTEQCAETLQQI